MDGNDSSEQLEEGEIRDEDDFSDISDNFIIDSSSLLGGKFPSSNETLRALSLSSDSESETFISLKPKRKLHRKNRFSHNHKKRKKTQVLSDSSDSDSSIYRHLKGKLKEAINISGHEGVQRNPLETRLKAMGGIKNTHHEVPPAPDPPHITSEDLENSDKIDDNELENLRIEALKTAVLNKFQMRKKRKAMLESQTVAIPETAQTLENKENNTPVTSTNNENKESVNGATDNALDLEEDEDVLRAALLAALPKKITKTTNNESCLKPKEPQIAKLPNKVMSVLPKRTFANIVQKNAIVQNVPRPQVKPLIINVNDDSDTDEEAKVKQIDSKVQKAPELNNISNTVEKFLKEQRAKFELNQKDETVMLEKSAVKLLPKSQQIEYQQLLKRLKYAERKKKLTKKIAAQKALAAAKSEETKQENPVQTGVAVETNEISKTVIITKSPQEVITSSSSIERQEKKKSGITNELTTLQKILKEIKIQRNGSLQIKSKYQVLTSIIKKITATSNERKKQEQRIKTLLEELKEARSDLAKSHEKFSTLVKDLASRKEKIDKSTKYTANIDSNNKNSKDCNQNIDNGHKEENKFTPVTSTPIKPQINNDIAEESVISAIATNSTNTECEDMDVCYSDDADMCQIDIVDPNDIDQIFKRKTVIKSTIPDYVSPLNLNTCERYKHVDPLGIMCPYEVNGSCRDIECTFKHYLKKN